MAENGVSSGNQEKTIDIEYKDGLLDELNLPPNVIKFIRENARNLQIAAACIVLLVFAWAYYDYYTETRQNEAAAALSGAIQEPDQALRLERLKEVKENFSGTGAALWSRVEQAHLAVQSGNYEQAIAEYIDILDDIDSGSPLLPLVTYNLGLAYENSGAPDKALRHYARLAAFKGFEVKGLMAQGRVHELSAESTEALKYYRQAIEIDAIASQDRNILAEKIAALQKPGSADK